MKTIIYSHPYNRSFNKAILDRIIEKLERGKEEYILIDLYKDNFNPVMTEKDLEVYSNGESLDPLVKKYQKILTETDEIIIIFPIWWLTMPAILKGFFDKVMLKGFAYKESKYGIKGLLNNIKTAKVITTATSPKFVMQIFGFGMFIKTAVLKGIGIKKSKWIHCSFKISDTDEKRKKFLKKVENIIGK